MTSPSNNDTKMNKNIEQKIIAQLDQSIDELSSNEQQSIVQARTLALSKLRTTKSESNSGQFSFSLHRLFNASTLGNSSFYKMALPIAATITIVVSLRYFSVNAIPALPIAMMTTEIPLEDFALLEDLEFVTWLAENETNITL